MSKDMLQESDGKKSMARTVAWTWFLWTVAVATAFVIKILWKGGDVPPELWKFIASIFAGTVFAYAFNKLGTKANGK